MKNKDNTLKLYVLEFVLALVSVISLFCLVYNLNYKEFSFLAVVVIFFMYSCLFLMGYVIYKIIKNNKNKWHKIYVSLMIPIGLLYLFFLIPGQAPDEHYHYYRAYEISTGKLISDNTEDNQDVIMELPGDLVCINKDNITKYNQVIDVMNIKTDYNKTTEVNNKQTRGYAPILYAIPAFSFTIGRILNLNIIYALYFAKIINFIVSLLLGYYTIKLIPFGKILMTTYLFIPMLIHQAVALSPDSIVNSVLLLFIAFILNLYFRKEDITKKEKIIFYAFSLFIAFAKTAYVPVILLSAILLPKNKNEEEKGMNKFFCKNNVYIFVGILISFLVALTWCMTLNNLKDTNVVSNDTTYISAFFSIISHPIEFLKLIINTIIRHEGYFLETFIGSQLGWLNININDIVIIIYLFMLICSPFLEKHKLELTTKQKIYLTFIFLICFGLIFFSMYLVWEQYYIGYILGVQGRYFIPVAVLLLLGLCSKNKYVKFKYFNYVYPSLIVVLNLIVVYQIVMYFI